MNETTALLPDIKLRFNIDHPSLEECYAYGYECAQADVQESENPYSEDSNEFEQWQDGWWAGFYGEEPLFGSDDEQLDKEHPKTGHDAANDHVFPMTGGAFFMNVLKITGAIAASALVGYQLLDLVA